MANLEQALREIDVMTGAADRILTLWHRMPEAADQKLVSAYPANLPAFEELLSALVTWQDAVKGAVEDEAAVEE